MNATKVLLRYLSRGDRFSLDGVIYEFISDEHSHVRTAKIKSSKVQKEPGVFVESEYRISLEDLPGDTEVIVMSEQAENPIEEPEEIAAISRSQLEEGFRQAQAVQVKPAKLSQMETYVALQRKWHHVYPDKPVPEDWKELLRLIPSTLRHEDKINFLRGSVEEAKHKFIVHLNQSWSKPELYHALNSEGIGNALKAFDAGTQKSLEGVIAFLTD